MDVAVSADPIHTALPWAGTKIILEVHQLFGTMFPIYIHFLVAHPFIGSWIRSETDLVSTRFSTSFTDVNYTKLSCMRAQVEHSRSFVRLYLTSMQLNGNSWQKQFILITGTQCSES